MEQSGRGPVSEGEGEGDVVPAVAPAVDGPASEDDGGDGAGDGFVVDVVAGRGAPVVEFCVRPALGEGDEVPQAWSLTAFEEVDAAAQDAVQLPGGAGGADHVDPDVDVDPAVVGDAANRARVAAVLAVRERRRVEAAARAAAEVVTLAELAAAWACPHPTAAQLQDQEVAAEWRVACGEPINRGAHRGLSVAGIHDGYHGVCWEGIEGCAQVLAARTPSWTLGYARAQVTRAVRLSRGLPATLAAWAAGAVDGRQVDVIVAGTDLVNADPEPEPEGDPDCQGALSLLGRVDERLCGLGWHGVEHTATLSTGALRERVRQVVAEVDAAAVAERSRRAAARRSVRRYDEADGHAALVLRGPAPAVAEMEAAINAAGAASKTEATRRNREGLPSLDPWALPADGEKDRRGIDAHRFDAAHTLITGAAAGLATGLATTTKGASDASGSEGGWEGGGRDEDEESRASAAAGAAGHRPTAATDAADEGEGGDVVVIRTRQLVQRWAVLAGMPRPHAPHVLVGLSALAGVDGGPAQLDGYGPLPTWMAMAMARHRGLRRMITDPLTGTLRHLDGHVYPPGHLDGLTPRPDPDPDPDPGPGDESEPGDGPDDGGGHGGGPGGSGSSSGGGRPGGGGSGSAPRDPGPSHPPRDHGSCSPLDDRNHQHGHQHVPAGHKDGEPAAAPAAPAEPCQPVDPDACPVRISGLTAIALGLPGRPSGTYAPSAALAAFVRRHWATCTATGCRRRAPTCDIDHTIPWPTGTTCSCDLAPLCRGHHAMKHGTPHFGAGPPAAWAARAGTLPWQWTLFRCEAGHQHWTDPLGATHTVTAPPPLGAPRAPLSATPAQGSSTAPGPDAASPDLISALPALDYPTPTHQVRPAPSTIDTPAAEQHPNGDHDDPPPF